VVGVGRTLLVVAGSAFLLLGIAGIIVPMLPTAPSAARPNASRLGNEGAIGRRAKAARRAPAN
jgi:hypothetical protein